MFARRDTADDDTAEYHDWVLSELGERAPRSSKGSSFRTKLTLLLSVAGLVTLALIGKATGVFSEPAPPPSPFAVWLADHRKHAQAVVAPTQRLAAWMPPTEDKSSHRCDWVVGLMQAEDDDLSEEDQKIKYKSQSTDANAFYRATANIFWRDFVLHGWGNFDLEQVGGIPANALADHSPLQRKSTWTWITGDQHLSNFGAWRNRHGDIVFGVNDFDEAAIFDFQMDVWRLAVSIYDHAMTNGLTRDEAAGAVVAFTDEYVSTVSGYMDNERAMLHELTSANVNRKATTLASFLDAMQSEEALHTQLRRFTVHGADGKRRFKFNNSTQLEPVEPALYDEIVRAMGKQKYGSTLAKIGWRIRPWSDEYYEVRDVGRRVSSGDGSFGVTRYYVLLAGSDTLVNQIAVDGVILDVKYVPTPAIRGVLSEDDWPWYETLFANEGARCVEAQRRLTSYTDPFAGWVSIHGGVHVVRQRSPWKASVDLSRIKEQAEFGDFVRQVAMVTATSHVRGGVGKAPVQFKEVIAAALDSVRARAQWGASVARTAAAYREQVLLDFQCFRSWVRDKAPLEAFEELASDAFLG